jgi:hypothetical protein
MVEIILCVYQRRKRSLETSLAIKQVIIAAIVQERVKPA